MRTRATSATSSTAPSREAAILEDAGNLRYIIDCAFQGGVDARFVDINDIGKGQEGVFTDADDNTIVRLFRFYPWEWLMAEDSEGLLENMAGFETDYIEPLWRMLLSNKGYLAMMWEKFKGHPNLLPAYFEDRVDADVLGSEFVRKPLLGREGADVEIVSGEDACKANVGLYGKEGYVVQKYARLPDMGGMYPVIGSWVVSGQASGLCVRESAQRITTTKAFFLPHVLV